MDKILLFIINKCPYLYKRYNMCITNGEYFEANGGSGTVILENELLVLNFFYDRSIMNLTIKSKFSKSDAFAIWYIMEFITGDKNLWRYDFSKFPSNIPSIDNEKYYQVFNENFYQIYELFSEQRYMETENELNILIKGIF